MTELDPCPHCGEQANVRRLLTYSYTTGWAIDLAGRLPPFYCFKCQKRRDDVVCIDHRAVQDVEGLRDG